MIEKDLLRAGEKAVFLDVRQKVTEEDLDRGFVAIAFAYKAKIDDNEGSKAELIAGESRVSISIETGLPIKPQMQPEDL